MPSQGPEEPYYRGIDLFEEGKLDGAIAAFRDAIEIDPTFVDALDALARILMQKGDLQEAIEYARRVAQIQPDDPLPHTNLSICYQKLGLIKEAEEEAAKAKVLGWKQRLKK